jgi:hypothetical protein
LVRQVVGICLGDAMFTLFRYGLMPVVVYCVVVITAGIDTVWTNTVRKATWPQTVAHVLQSQDLGDVAASFRGTPNTFPDPRGTVTYLVDGKSYAWQGRGREIGVTVMKPGDRINVYYNPKNPREISTLALLGASTGSIIMAVAFAFLAFYVWFFWLRGFFRRSGPDDFDSEVGSFAGQGQMERSRSGLGDAHPAAIIKGPLEGSFEPAPRATFGKR